MEGLRVPIDVSEVRYIPYAEAKRLLEAIIRDGISSNVLQKTYEYLNSMGKCEAENAAKLTESLKSMGLREEVAAMIASICPLSVEEIRSIALLEGKTFSQDELQLVLDLVKKYIER